MTSSCLTNEILKSQLLSLCITDFEFMRDEQLPPNTVQIKTLIWTASTTSLCSKTNNDDGTQRNHIEVDPSQVQVYATALRAIDFVDENFLLDKVRSKYYAHYDCEDKLKLTLTDKEVAEHLTGYKSRTISPIFNSTAMNLFFDRNILEDVETNGCYVSVGAGIIDSSLYISWDSLFLAATRSNLSVDVCRVSRYIMKREPTNDLDDRLGVLEKNTTKSLSRQLLDAAGKRGRWFEVQRLIGIIGPSFPSMMICGSDGHFTKNALHLSAWKGDIQSIHLLIDAGNQYGLDLVNAISTGVGNYGKTPIFYAITQDRDDVVRLLIKRGSKLLIVNNKGQTPSSLSIAHLSIETQNILFEEEKRQLQLGGKFMNYRETHSDHRSYGDLDPRFPIDVANWDADIEQEFLQLNVSDLLPIDNYSRAPANFPRCVRQTTAQTRMVRAMENRLKLPIDAVVEERFNHIPTKKKETIHKTEKMAVFESSISFQDISYLNHDGNNKIMIVQSYEDLKLFAGDVDSFITYMSLTGDAGHLDFDLLQRSWSLDCEWKPTFNGEEHPISILQLSTISVSYILDLQSLCQRPKASYDFEMTGSEILLNNVLKEIFTNNRIIVIGFDAMNDLERLAGSYPQIPCFVQQYESVIDIRDLISKVTPTSSVKSSSLRKLVQTLLDKDMDKSLQCSDWSQRPLTAEQIHYAALDSVILLALLDHIIKQTSASLVLSLQKSIRFVLVGGLFGQKYTDRHETASLKLKRILGFWFLRETWFKSNQHDHGAVISIHQAKENVGCSRIKSHKQVISSSELFCKVHSLPCIGEALGFTKGECIQRFVFFDQPDIDYSISFNRRAGIVQLANAWALFVNVSPQLYDASNKRDHLDFFISLKSSHQCRILRDINDKSESRKKILLSLRFTNGKYIFYGECVCISKSVVDDLLKMTLELETSLPTDYESGYLNDTNQF